MAGEDHTNEPQDDGGAVKAASGEGAVVGFTLAEAEARGLLSADLVERRVSLLRAAVPEAFGEGVVDWGLLRKLVEGMRKGKGVGGAGGETGGETGEEDRRTGDDGADHLFGGDGDDVILFDDADLAQGSVQGGAGKDLAIYTDEGTSLALSLASHGLEALFAGAGDTESQARTTNFI